MGQTLTNGVYLPAEGERNCYEGLAANWTALDGMIGGYNVHISNTTIHVTAEDKQAWNGKADASALTAHTGDTTIHVTSADKQAWDGHVADTTIHVTSADKQAWNGKADASALTAHTGDTTIHVTAEDKNKWDAVTSKADDSAVVHNSGNETIAGIKTFTDNTFVKSLNFTNEVASPSSSSSAILPIIATVTYTDQSSPQSARLNLRVTANGDKSLYPHENNQYSLGLPSRKWTNIYGYLVNLTGMYFGDEASINERTNICLLANRDTDGQSGAYLGRFRQNRLQGAMSGGDVSFISFSFLENSIRYSRCFNMGLTDWDTNGEPQTYYFSSTGGKGILGTSSDRWNDVQTNAINGLNPGALSMPDLSAGVDISGYITLGTYQQDTYTPPSDGYISIMIYGTAANGLYIYSGSFGAGMRSIGGHPTYGQLSVVCVPVRAGITYTIETTGATSIGWAKFFPCQGNV